MANAAGLIAALLRSDGIAQLAENFSLVAVKLEPALLFAICGLYLLAGWISRRTYPVGLFTVMLIASASALVMTPVWATLGSRPVTLEMGWNVFYAALLALVLAAYFDLRLRAFSPALSEARLQALQARIRPHFLFNSLNAVISLIRRDPRRAETALEDLADLFRSVLSDTRQLVPLADEFAITRQYLALEHLRLGERLLVEWDIDPSTEAALVPPMLLQPLVENAVYHGIEPGLEPGTVRISARRDGERMRLQLSNPYHPDHQHRQGNRMALENIAERLSLHFDMEAALDTRVEEGRFNISIVLPTRFSARGER